MHTITKEELRELSRYNTMSDSFDKFIGETTIIIDSCHYDYLEPDAIDYEHYDLRCSRDGQRCS